MLKCIWIISIFCSIKITAQTFGNNSVFNVLTFNADVNAQSKGGFSGGFNEKTVTAIFSNPAFVHDDLLNNATVNWLNIYGVNTSALAYTLKNKIHGYTSTVSLRYFNYGNVQQTDEYGNVLGNFTPQDFVLGFSAAKKYEDNFVIGGSINFILSSLQNKNISGLFSDFGAVYTSPNQRNKVNVLFKNIGFSFQKLNSDIPFDFQLGYCYKPEKFPIIFGVQTQQLQQFNLLEKEFINLQGDIKKTSATKQAFAHCSFFVQSNFEQLVNFNIGLNLRNRFQLQQLRTANGLLGFATGINAQLKKIHLNYSLQYYTNNNPFHSLGISFNVNNLSKNW